ncbi:hypothetical protein FOZ60_003675 [Perkinsus olseni]|uniref:Uncharacterized protein n=1 Tax=Perkinsus olseni TaxID=32597 RepID=A0A7J6PI63_PEROL|nr:hypothetical protein FOZ60_003675 [Perkinsus olseni]
MTDISPFGGLLVPLPFKIRSFQQSSMNDVCINPWYTSNNDHPEAVMVIGLPDEGVFDYVDYFLKQNPHKYVELSERTMFDWFKASALRPIRRGPVASNDRPDFLFGVQPFDEGFVRKQLREFAKMPHGRKNLVLVEIRGGLLEEERSKIMEQFPGRERTAVVCVGKPTADYTAYVKDIVRGEIFAEKELERERKLNVLKHEYKIRQMERERAKKVREAARAAERARIEAAEEARKKREEAAAAAAKEAGDEGKDEAKTKEGDQKMEPAPVEEKKEEAPKEEAEEEEEEPEPTLPPTEVTDEEIKQRLRVENVEDSRTANLVREEKLSEGCYRKMPFSDISHKALSECYLSFTLPQETEKTPRGLQAFDSIKFVWEKKAAATQRLEAWVKSHKVLEKVSSITGPTDWFKQQMEAWMNTKLEWRKAQRLYQEEQAKARSPDEKMEDAPAEVDVWVPEDVCDIDAKKTPLFAKFQLVDWQLMNLRYELHLLCHAFERDATSQDADLKGIHKSLLQHYYQTYVMRGVLVPSLYGAHSLDQILDTLLVDTIMIDKDGVLKAVHDIDAPLSTFVRLTEAARREREAKIAAGDDSAKLMVIQPTIQLLVEGLWVVSIREGERYQSGGKGYANGGPQQQQYYAYKRPYDTGAYDPSKRQKGGRGGSDNFMGGNLFVVIPRYEFTVSRRVALMAALVMVQRPPAPPPPRGEVSPTESEREENALPNHEEELLDLRKDIMVSIEKLCRIGGRRDTDESNDVMAEEIRSASGDDLTEARELYSYIEENMDVLERKFRKLRAINRKLGLPEEDGCCGQPKMKLPWAVALFCGLTSGGGPSRHSLVVTISYANGLGGRRAQPGRGYRRSLALACRTCSTLVQRVPDGRLLFTWEGRRDGSKLRKAEILAALSDDRIGALSNEEFKLHVLAAVKGRADFNRAGRLWSTVRDEILRRVTELHPSDLTALLNAVARGGVREADRLCDAAAAHAGQNIVLFTPGYLAQFLASLSNLNATAKRPAIKAFLDCLQEHLLGGGLNVKWSPRDAAVLVGAVAKLTKDGRGYEDLAKFVGEVLLLPEVGRFQPIEFATAASAFSRLPMGCGRKVMREMARVLPDRLGEFGEQELCNTVQAYARLEMWELAVFTAAANALMKMKKAMSPIGLSSIAGSYSKLPAVDGRLTEFLLRQAVICLDRPGQGRGVFERQELSLFLNAAVQMSVGAKGSLTKEGRGVLAMLFQRYAGMESSREEYRFNAMVARAVGRCIRAGVLPAEALERHLRPPLSSQPTPTLQDYACILNAAFDALEVSENGAVELGDFAWVVEGVSKALAREPENSKQICICMQGMAALELGDVALWRDLTRRMFSEENRRHLPIGELSTALRALRKISRRGEDFRDIAVGCSRYVDRSFERLVDYEVLDLPSAVSIYHSLYGSPTGGGQLGSPCVAGMDISSVSSARSERCCLDALGGLSRATKFRLCG